MILTGITSRDDDNVVRITYNLKSSGDFNGQSTIGASGSYDCKISFNLKTWVMINCFDRIARESHGETCVHWGNITMVKITGIRNREPSTQRAFSESAD
jgi:hypothetical protein